MNSAAVIGRQLRQQNTGQRGQQGKGGRQRALSHQTLTPAQLHQLQLKKEEEAKKKVGFVQNIRNKVTLQCLWLTCKALSGGTILLIIGTTMSVVGFYADTLSTELREVGNSTVEVTDQTRHFHLHNLTYVGPVIMGLGGFFIVAAFVLTFEGKDSGSKVVPVIDDHSTNEGSLLTSLLIEDRPKDKPNGTASGPYLCVPGSVDTNTARKPSVTIANGRTIIPKDESKTGVKPKTSDPKGARRKELPSVQVSTPNGFSRSSRPPPNLPLMRARNRELMMMQLCLDEFVPSPQDIEIQDPDGCDTPRQDSSMDMEVYVSNCPITVRVQVETRHLASMESDGLSDSDVSDPGEMARRDRELQAPLLGRCSPGGLEPAPPRRFAPLLRQGALERCGGRP